LIDEMLWSESRRSHPARGESMGTYQQATSREMTPEIIIPETQMRP
jgi:hypothetical protein